MGDVISLQFKDPDPVTPEDVLAAAGTRKFRSLFVIGELDDGTPHLECSDMSLADLFELLDCIQIQPGDAS